jgi:hypothetical protein
LRALPWHHARNIADTVADVLTPRAEDQERLNGTLNQLRDMMTSIIPQEFHGVLHGVSVAPFRRELFAMMHGADSRVARIAEACLSHIDYLRDYIGAVEPEPRHPDLASGKTMAARGSEH